MPATFRDHGHLLFSDHLLLFFDFVQACFWIISTNRPEWLRREPAFSPSKFRWIDSWTSVSAPRPSWQPGRMQRPPGSHHSGSRAFRRTIVEQHHRARRIDHARRRVRLRRRRSPCRSLPERRARPRSSWVSAFRRGEHGVFDRPRRPRTFFRIWNLGLAVGFQDRAWPHRGRKWLSQ